MTPGYKVDVNGCHIWQSKLRGIVRSPYRTIYEYVNNVALDSSQVLHHMCGNDMCVNLEHLQLTTHSEHAKTHGYLANLSPGERSRRAKKAAQKRQASGKPLFPIEILRAPKTAEHKAKIAASNRAHWESLTPEERRKRGKKIATAKRSKSSQ